MGRNSESVKSTDGSGHVDQALDVKVEPKFIVFLGSILTGPQWVQNIWRFQQRFSMGYQAELEKQ